MFVNGLNSRLFPLPSMNRRKEVVDNEVSHVAAEARSGGEIKAEVDSGKYSAEGRLLGCAGEAAK